MTPDDDTQPRSWQDHLDQLGLRPIDIQDVAAYLGVARSTVYNLIDGGTLRGTRIAGRIKVRTRDLRAFLENPSSSDT